MAVGTGIECINLKKAKYNRDMRLIRAEAMSQNAEASHYAPASGSTYDARRGCVPVNNGRTGAVNVHRAPSVEIPADDGVTLKDILTAVGKELSKEYASYKRNKLRERARAPKYVTKNVKAKTAFPVSVIGYIVVFSVIAMFLVLGNSKINEATIYSNSLENEISAAMKRCEMLTAEVSSRNDAASVENYALDVLGLVRKTDVAKTYVSISGEDKVIVSGSESGHSASGIVTMTLDSGN